MKIITGSLISILALALTSTVQADIYESKDAAGNPVFTDSPSPGSSKVDLPEENIADSVEPRPKAAAKTAAPAPAANEQQDNITVIHDGYNENLDDELLVRRRHEVRDGEVRQEAGDFDKEGPHHENRADGVARPLPAARPSPGVHRR